MSRTDELLAKLKTKRGEKVLEHEKIKEARSAIRKLDKDIADIIDEMTGVKVFPLCELAEKEEEKLVQAIAIEPSILETDLQQLLAEPQGLITFDRAGKPGSSFDCLFLYQDESAYELPFDIVELNFIGEDPDSYENYTDLCNKAWVDVQQADQEDLQRLINYCNEHGIAPRDPNKIAWAFKGEKNDQIILIKGVERRIIPAWAKHEFGLRTLAHEILSSMVKDDGLNKLWQKLETDPSKMSVAQRIEMGIVGTSGKKYQFIGASNEPKTLGWLAMEYDEEIRNVLPGNRVNDLLKYFKVNQLSDLSQSDLAAIWHNPERFMPNNNLKVVQTVEETTKSIRPKQTRKKASVTA